MPRDMSDDEFELTLLGTGTSTGVPTVSCNCATCTSDDPRDKRLRCSALLRTNNTTVIIDTGPDFRKQMLRYNVNTLDAAVYTHHHFDHIGGFDDIRGFNFTSENPLPIYINDETLDNLKNIFSYAFKEKEGNVSSIPKFQLNRIHRDDFQIGDINFEIIPLLHGNLEVLGFRIGDIAYCTDTNYIPPESLEKLQGVKYLVLDALRPNSHNTHFNIEEAVEAAQQIGAEKTFFIHIAHQVKHSEWEDRLPENIHLAYDGLKLKGKLG